MSAFDSVGAICGDDLDGSGVIVPIRPVASGGGCDAIGYRRSFHPNASGGSGARADPSGMIAFAIAAGM